MMNLRSWKKIGDRSTKLGSSTVRFIRMLQMEVIAYRELTISKRELSIMNSGSDTFTLPASA
jgi:hypothetical protein